jgi:plasmid stabilization system protein ParE
VSRYQLTPEAQSNLEAIADFIAEERFAGRPPSSGRPLFAQLTDRDERLERQALPCAAGKPLA